jgi:hypothetical protein
MTGSSTPSGPTPAWWCRRCTPAPATASTGPSISPPATDREAADGPLNHNRLTARCNPGAVLSPSAIVHSRAVSEQTPVIASSGRAVCPPPVHRAHPSAPSNLRLPPPTRSGFVGPGLVALPPRRAYPLAIQHRLSRPITSGFVGAVPCAGPPRRAYPVPITDTMHVRLCGVAWRSRDFISGNDRVSALEQVRGDARD